tara:strand:+ start:114 stop:248 length:135 start_codon:yes stop_codon:yes gene_type:complete
MIAIAYLKIKGYDLSNSNILVAFAIETLFLLGIAAGIDLIRYTL